MEALRMNEISNFITHHFSVNLLVAIMTDKLDTCHTKFFLKEG